jgi:hypothetical protein
LFKDRTSSLQNVIIVVYNLNLRIILKDKPKNLYNLVLFTSIGVYSEVIEIIYIRRYALTERTKLDCGYSSKVHENEQNK